MRRKILLDSDVVIHFIAGELFSKLPDILPDFDFVLLDVVYENELKKRHGRIIEQCVHFLRKMSIIKWEYTKEELIEFCELQKIYGLGESAAMTYCRHHRDVLASSNWKDIISYCNIHGITHLSTMDLLHQALKDGILSEGECDEFIYKVLKQGHKLPCMTMKDFQPRIYYRKGQGFIEK